MNTHNPYGQSGKSMLEEIKNFFNKKDVLSRLMVINIVVFLVINLFALITFIAGFDTGFAMEYGVTRLTYWLSLPSNLGSFLFRPWSLFTYMFVQEGVFHLFFNMLLLYVGGKIFTQFIGADKLLSTYILGGITGAILYVLTFNIFPAFQTVVGGSFAIGASASVLAVFVAAAAYVPNLQLNVVLLGNVKLKYIAIVFVVLDLLNIRNGNAGGHIAHIGGAIYGLLYVSNLKKNRDFNLWFNKWTAGIKKYFTSPSKKKTPFSNIYTNPKPPRKDEDYLKQKNEKQAEIDKILEKIKKSGYESLSAREKQMLFDASNEN